MKHTEQWIWLPESLYPENQKTILIAAGTTEERLEKGTLIPAETKLLEMLTAAEKHLAERYSGTAFTFTGLDTTLPRGDRYHFLASDGRNEFAVLVWPGEKNTYKISDSYFSDLKRAELNEFCEEVLAGFGLKAKADLELTGVYGSEYSHTVSLKNILESGKMIGISGWVFAENLSGLEAIQPEMEKALCQGQFALAASHLLPIVLYSALTMAAAAGCFLWQMKKQ